MSLTDSLNVGQKIHQALQFLFEYPDETPTTAARIYKCKPDSVRRAFRRHNKRQEKRKHGVISKKSGGHNKILTSEQETAIFQYIESQYQGGLGATKRMVYNAVCTLRTNESKTAPTEQWFRQWTKSKSHIFHAIKAKPIAKVRVNLHDEKTVERWFQRFQAKLDERGIQSGSQIYNFDETGVRVGCPGGEVILVPTHVTELYTPSPENRKSVSIIEAIYADGSEPPPPATLFQESTTWLIGIMPTSQVNKPLLCVL